MKISNKIYRVCYFIVLAGIMIFILSLFLKDPVDAIVGRISAGVIFSPIFVAFIAFLFGWRKK